MFFRVINDFHICYNDWIAGWYCVQKKMTSRIKTFKRNAFSLNRMPIYVFFDPELYGKGYNNIDEIY